VKPDGLYISASALRLLGDCGRGFGYRYIAGYPAEDVAPALVLGKAVHAALAVWFERLRDGASEATLDELIAIALASIDEAKRDAVPIASNDNDEDLAAEAVRMLRAFAVNPMRPARVLAVELPFQIAVPRHPITGESYALDESIAGVIDLVVEDADGLLVVDHKVGKRAPAIDGGIDLQLALYALAIEEMIRPDKPVRLAHHVLVRTKVPKIELREVPRTPNDVAEALEAIASGVALIHAAIGHPRPLRLLGRHRSWRCGGCGYRRRCAGDRT
jgi:CRISPR/Cas system-associated exonuclease Cas4 (RecB family)